MSATTPLQRNGGETPNFEPHPRNFGVKLQKATLRNPSWSQKVSDWRGAKLGPKKEGTRLQPQHQFEPRRHGAAATA